MDLVNHDLEAAVAVYQLHYCHRSDKEDDNLTGVAECLHHFRRDVGIVGTQRIDCPKESTHDQREGCLVHTEHVFRGYKDIADNEDD